MRSFRRCFFLAPCAVALVGVAACGRYATAPAQATQAPAEQKNTAASAASSTPPTAATTTTITTSSATPATPQPPASSPTADQRLAHALDQLGAEHGPRGEVLRLPEAGFAAGQAQFKVKAGNGTDLQ